MTTFTYPTWLKPDGSSLACVEKIKVLNENLEELRQLAQDALDDAVLMGGGEVQMREVLHALVDSLVSNYPEQLP